MTEAPAFAAPVIAVDSDWVAANGSRAQRRRVAKALRKAEGRQRQAGATI